MQSSVRILLIDDDDDLRDVLGRALDLKGYSVTGASDCHTALSALLSQTFDVVLLDISLPDGSGFRILDWLKERQQSPKVIMLTGTVGLENAVRSVVRGAHDYITKPFTINYLLRSIQHVLTS